MRQTLRNLDFWQILFWSTLAVVTLSIMSCNKRMPETIDQVSIAGGQYHQVAVEPVGNLPDLPGKDKEDLIAVITVPTFTVDSKGNIKPDKAVVQVYREKKSLRQRLLPKKDEPKIPASVASTVPGTKAYYEESWPWWYWILGVIGIFAVVTWIVSKYTSWLSGPISWLKKFL